MVIVSKMPLPDGALLSRYAVRPDCYTDCYGIAVPDSDVSLEAFLQAFYSTWLFRCEKWILDRTIKRPSGTEELSLLASGKGTSFAAWDVEARSAAEVLLCDFSGHTRSWLMVTPEANGTMLYFGSAVVPPREGAKLGVLFHGLKGFHKAYSKALLRAAARRLRSRKLLKT